MRGVCTIVQLHLLVSSLIVNVWIHSPLLLVVVGDEDENGSGAAASCTISTSNVRFRRRRLVPLSFSYLVVAAVLVFTCPPCFVRSFRLFLYTQTSQWKAKVSSDDFSKSLVLLVVGPKILLWVEWINWLNQPLTFHVRWTSTTWKLNAKHIIWLVQSLVV